MEIKRYQPLINRVGLGISGILLAACAPVMAASFESSSQLSESGQVSQIDTCYGYTPGENSELYLVDLTGAPQGAEKALEPDVTCFDSDPTSSEYPQFAVLRTPNGDRSVVDVNGLTAQEVTMAFEGSLEYMR